MTMKVSSPKLPAFMITLNSSILRFPTRIGYHARDHVIPHLYFNQATSSV